MQFQQLILTTIKPKIVQCFSNIKKWLKPSYLKNKLLTKTRGLITGFLNIRPADRNDYYSFARWLVSRKLANAIVFFLIIFCFCYIAVTVPKKPPDDAGQLKTYRYNDLTLKFMTGQVAILGKSNYLAYKGEISEGAVNGTGSLYAPDGNLVYRGEFKNNQYEGLGRRYYSNSVLWYDGRFSENQFEGEGKLYRKNGTMEYEGDFLENKKDGSGILYDGSENKVYEGRFQKDCIVYVEFLNKTTKEIAENYTGRKMIYTADAQYCVSLTDINAVYTAHSGENTLEGEWIVDGIYVLDNEINLNGKKINKIAQITQTLGSVAYEGNTALKLPDAVALNMAARQKNFSMTPVDMKVTDLLEDCFQVEQYDTARLIYLYQYQTDQYIYTFFCNEKNKGFDFYLIENTGE